MKIEMALPTLEIGGMEQMVVSLAQALQARGHTVGVTCLNAGGSFAAPLADAGIRVSVVHAPGFVSNFRAADLTRHFAKLAPDVVHSHSGVWGRASRAARAAEVGRCVHTVHGKLDKDPWYDIPLKRWEASQSDVVVAVSDALRLDLTERIGVPSNKVHLCINGVDTVRFCPDHDDRGEIREQLGVSSRTVIGIIARLARVKNYPGLLASLAIVRRIHPDVMLLCIGDGPMEAILKEMVESLGLSDAVQFLGSRHDTARLYRAFDLFVLPSFAEGTSISILEAMASGVPVVATAVGGTPSLLDYGTSGFLAASTSSEDISAAILSLLANREEGTLRSESARRRVLDLYSIAGMVTQYEAFYDRPTGTRS
jgi:glycosyltransferase involved in cell wall biosynthesis